MYYISVVQKPSAYQDWFRYEEFVFHQGIALLKNSGTQGQVYLIHIVSTSWFGETLNYQVKSRRKTV